MSIDVSSTGWVRSVNGIPVTKRPVPSSNYYSGWPAPAHGIMLHYTAGCQNDIYTTLVARGISAHFCVGRDGSIYQYVSLKDRAAHAYDANHTHFGIEHTALPGTCDLTKEQRNASAKLSAGIREWGEPRGIHIPAQHVAGCDLAAHGFKEHADGIGCYWNPNVHTDNPGTRWGWDVYLGLVKGFKPPVAVDYKVGSRIFDKLDGAVRYLRRLLQKRKPGEVHEIKVVREQ